MQIISIIIISGISSEFGDASFRALGFPGDSVVKNLPVNAGDMGLIPGSGRSPGEGNGNPLQYSCLENPRDRGAWWAAVHGVAKIHTLTNTFIFFCDTGELNFNLVTLGVMEADK